jgi:hypothetical protein
MRYPDVQTVAPGDTVSVRAWLISPDVYPSRLWMGREIDVIEAPNNVVGKLTVTRIFNKIFCGDAKSYNRNWVKPDYLD